MTTTNTTRPLDINSPYSEMAVTPAFDIPPQARSPVSANVSTTAPRNDQMTALGHDRPYLPVGLPVPLPTHTEAQPLFTALQKWQGTVSQVTDSTFSAVLLDLLEPSVEEVAEFDLEEVSRGDLDLIAPGAVFYWSIGYRTEPSGERSRSSVLVFRRLPAWSEKDLQRATDNAKELRNNFGW